MASLACVVALPVCGKMVTLSQVSKGWSAGNGSGVHTSRPAPEMQQLRRLEREGVEVSIYHFYNDVSDSKLSYNQKGAASM